MITIISFKICPCYQTISALFEAFNIPYKSEFLDLNHIPGWFLEISPAIEPAIQLENGDYISGLDSVINYIENNLTPAFKENTGEDEKWYDLAKKQYIHQCIALRSSDILTLEKNSLVFSEGLKEIEEQIGTAKFFKGNSLSAVDIAWLPILHRLQIVEAKTGFDFLAPYPNLKRWQRNIMITEIPEKSVPHDFEEEFALYYFNSSTFFGKLYNQDLHFPKSFFTKLFCPTYKT